MKKSLVSTLVPILAIAVFLGARYLYFRPELIQGDRAPAFSARLIDGQDFSLSDLEGRYVLLDFWGSWCPPCRAQNPKWVAFFQEWGGSDFSIVSIGVEKNEQAWRNAIRQDSLYWPHHILDKAESLRFFDSPLAMLYGVKQVPTTFLLNPAGVIVAYDPSPADVEAILKRSHNN